MQFRYPICCYVILFVLVGCGTPQRAYQPPPPPNFTAREIPFDDSPAFDSLLDTLLTNHTPVIRIVLDTTTPDWPDRLVVWLRAYRDGGQVQAPTGKGGLTSLLWLAANATSATEAREALEATFHRLEQTSTVLATWWDNERERQRRIDLLRPYIIDIERSPSHGNRFVLMLYNGHY
ncbi:MAG: hypothetical protein U0840_25770 [Gemmataceae bacterium]